MKQERLRLFGGTPHFDPLKKIKKKKKENKSPPDFLYHKIKLACLQKISSKKDGYVKI